MAKCLVLYRIADNIIADVVIAQDGAPFVFNNADSYVMQKDIIIDGKTIIYGLNTDTLAAIVLDCAIPENIFIKLHGEYIDLAHNTPAEPNFYKLNDELTAIIEA